MLHQKIPDFTLLFNFNRLFLSKTFWVFLIFHYSYNRYQRTLVHLTWLNSVVEMRQLFIHLLNNESIFIVNVIYNFCGSSNKVVSWCALSRYHILDYYLNDGGLVLVQLFWYFISSYYSLRYEKIVFNLAKTTCAILHCFRNDSDLCQEWISSVC